MVSPARPSSVDLLILGAGWTSTFLIPLLSTQSPPITHASTTTDGRNGTYKFKFASPSDVENCEDELKQYATLPSAKTVLITFPIKGSGGSGYLVENYIKTHSSCSPNFIQLGSTGIWTIPNQSPWVTRHSPYDTSNPRAIAEGELLGLGGCVLNLSGLWGGERHPRNWVERVAKTKEELRGKGSLHLVHGEDVARGILGVHFNFEGARGERFMLTDLTVHDWWSLILGFAADEKEEIKQVRWVGELMKEEGVRALPRDMETLGRCYDSREFWEMIGVTPSRSRV